MEDISTAAWDITVLRLYTVLSVQHSEVGDKQSLPPTHTLVPEETGWIKSLLLNLPSTLLSFKLKDTTFDSGTISLPYSSCIATTVAIRDKIQD